LVGDGLAFECDVFDGGDGDLFGDGFAVGVQQRFSVGVFEVDGDAALASRPLVGGPGGGGGVAVEEVEFVEEVVDGLVDAGGVGGGLQ
jgi:hypothetical protein